MKSVTESKTDSIPYEKSTWSGRIMFWCKVGKCVSSEKKDEKRNTKKENEMRKYIRNTNS